MMRPGTIPTTARDEGNESMPLETISALELLDQPIEPELKEIGETNIIKTATSCHDSVLYLIYGDSQTWDSTTCHSLPSAYLMILLVPEDIVVIVRRNSSIRW